MSSVIQKTPRAGLNVRFGGLLVLAGTRMSGCQALLERGEGLIGGALISATFGGPDSVFELKDRIVRSRAAPLLSVGIDQAENGMVFLDCFAVRAVVSGRLPLEQVEFNGLNSSPVRVEARVGRIKTGQSCL